MQRPGPARPGCLDLTRISCWSLNSKLCLDLASCFLQAARVWRIQQSYLNAPLHAVAIWPNVQLHGMYPRLWFNVWSLSFYILLSCFHSFTACFDCFQVLNFVEESSLNINFLFTFFISIFKTIYALYFIDIITVSIDLSSKALFSWNQNCMEFWWEYLWYMYSSS